MNKNKIIISIALLLFFFILIAYKPIQEDKIYQKKIELPNISDIHKDSLYDSKMIIKAKKTLEDMFSIKIEEDNYNIIVDYESNQISSHTIKSKKQDLTFAHVSFCDKNSDETTYIIECNTNTGEILMLAQKYMSPLSNSYKSLEELKFITKQFLVKMGIDIENDVLSYDGEIQGKTYRADITLNTNNQYIIYVDAVDGTAFYFLKIK